MYQKLHLLSHRQTPTTIHSVTLHSSRNVITQNSVAWVSDDAIKCMITNCVCPWWCASGTNPILDWAQEVSKSPSHVSLYPL